MTVRDNAQRWASIVPADFAWLRLVAARMAWLPSNALGVGSATKVW
jgi:hypothetical protein